MILVPGTVGKAPPKDFNEIRIEDDEDARRAKVEYWLCKQIGEHLMKVYPNRQWGVNVDSFNGVAVIMCPSVSQTKGYHLHLAKYGHIPNLLAAAARAAGEILERHDVTRSSVFRDFEIFDHLPQTLRGDVIAPDAAPEPLKKKVT